MYENKLEVYYVLELFQQISLHIASVQQRASTKQHPVVSCAVSSVVWESRDSRITDHTTSYRYILLTVRSRG